MWKDLKAVLIQAWKKHVQIPSAYLIKTVTKIDQILIHMNMFFFGYIGSP